MINKSPKIVTLLLWQAQLIWRNDCFFFVRIFTFFSSLKWFTAYIHMDLLRFYAFYLFSVSSLLFCFFFGLILFLLLLLICWFVCIYYLSLEFIVKSSWVHTNWIITFTFHFIFQTLVHRQKWKFFVEFTFALFMPRNYFLCHHQTKNRIK